MNAVIIIAGPTASGKSALAYQLVDRLNDREMPAEIISVDSAQIYRDMNIGTAKPTLAEQARYRHHLIDILSPEESYSAGRFRQEALTLIEQIHARGAIPILVGGTMLYFKVLREGIHDLPSANADIRNSMEQRAQKEGWQALHAELLAVDPESAKRINPNDRQRISRALELIAMGQTLSKSALPWASRPQNFPYRPLSIYLLPKDREHLRAQIQRRWRSMWEGGLWEEFNALCHRYRLEAHLPSQRSVGYRQLWQYAQSQDSALKWSLPTLHERALIATSQLAKRQITWLRAFIASAEASTTKVVDPYEESLKTIATACINRFFAHNEGEILYR